MKNFNILDYKFIPVRYIKHSGNKNPFLVSLTDAFIRCEEIADLDCAPHERIALLRLLICIAHAALGAPKSPDHWDDFGEDLEEKITAYLKRPEISPHFNLLGDGARFLQEDVPTNGEVTPLSKLTPYLATGNNPTSSDHFGISPHRKFTPAQTILALLAFQNFYPLYGAGYKGRGPCADGNAIHTFLHGKNLKAILLLNLLDHQTIQEFAPNGIGKPIWECKSDEELEASTRTYLGRLVPRHRSLKLTDDLSGFYHRKESLLYSSWEPYREPTSTGILNHKKERRLLSARLDRGIWRDLHSIIALKKNIQTEDVEVAPILRSHMLAFDAGECTLWTGALITDFKAKILDTVESTFTINHQMFSVHGYMTYLSGLNLAEIISTKLYGAIRVYWSALKHETPPTKEGQKHYWNCLDQDHRILIQLAGNPESPPGKADFGQAGAEDEWTKLVRGAAKRAYEAVCPRTTPRQLKAYAAGLSTLNRALFQKKEAK